MKELLAKHPDWIKDNLGVGKIIFEKLVSELGICGGLHVSFGDFHLLLLPYFFLSRSTLLTINLLQLHGSIVVLDAP